MRRTVSVGAAVVGVLTCLAVAAAAEAAYPGANGRIAFQRFTSTDSSDIYTMNPDGTDVRQLTDTPTLLNRIPAWSPDGTKIAFTSTRAGSEDVYVTNADGSDVTRLTTSSGFDFAPTWSPDGGRIAFRTDRDGNSEIYVMNADGSGQTDVTRNRGADYDPSWSPDGTKIAFWSTRDLDAEVYVMNADGSGQTNLSRDPGISDHSPDWAPDGSKIAFVSDRDVTREISIYTMEPDGTGVTRVTGGTVPGWAPDGTKLTYAAVGVGYISIVNSDGTGATRIPGSTALDYNPDWQPLPSRPPDCSAAAATPDSLWPPNHQLRLATLSGATDPDGDAVTIAVTGVTQDEAVSGKWDDTSPDATSAGSPNEVYLRVERDPRGDGRVYRVTFSASDGKGGTCSGTARVAVPRQMDVPAVDSPPSFDSFGQ